MTSTPSTPRTAVPAAVPARFTNAIWLAAFGALFVLAWAVVPHATGIIGWHNTITGGMTSLAQAHALCTSGPGTWAQSFSAAVASKCAQVGGIYNAVTVAGVTGLALCICAAVSAVRASTTITGTYGSAH